MSPPRRLTESHFQRVALPARGDKVEISSDGSIVALAETPGYEDHDGVGWHGVIIQQAEDDDVIRAALGIR